MADEKLKTKVLVEINEYMKMHKGYSDRKYACSLKLVKLKNNHFIGTVGLKESISCNGKAYLMTIDVYDDDDLVWHIGNSVIGYGNR